MSLQGLIQNDVERALLSPSVEEAGGYPVSLGLSPSISKIS